MKGWKHVKLEEVAESINAGGTPYRKESSFWDNGSIPWLKISDLKSKYIYEAEEKITKKGLENSSAKLFPEGTILYSIFATIGAIGILKKESTANQAIAGIVPNKKIILPEYLYYCLLSEKNKIYEKRSHATQDNINLTILRNHTIPLPPIETQKKIVSILEKAEKIKEKRKQVKILSEEYLRSIFSKVLSNKNGNVNKSFMELFDVKTGKLNSNASELGGKYPFFTCSKETFTINSYAYDEEALLLSGNNAAGEYSVKHYSGKFNAYQRTYILNLKEQGSYEFFRYQFENKLEFLRENSKGTNTKYLTLGILKNLNFILPPIETQLNFTTIAKKLEHTSRKQQLATEQASLLFDSLMKEAFKGGLVE